MAKAKAAARVPHLGYSFAHGRTLEAEDIVGPMKPMASHEQKKPMSARAATRPVSRKVSR